MPKVTADTPVPDHVKARTGVRLCAGTCGRWTRHTSLALADNPGTVVRGTGGKCQQCVNDDARNSRPAKEVAAEKLAQTITGLERFNRARQERQRKSGMVLR